MIKSRVLKHWSVVSVIIRNFPNLDPLAVLFNAELYYVGDKRIISFLSVKHYFDILELGPMYTFPEYRKQGYMDTLLNSVLRKYPGMTVVCRRELASFYHKYGFVEFPGSTLQRVRKFLFSLFFRPFTGYSLISMKRHAN